MIMKFGRCFNFYILMVGIFLCSDDTFATSYAVVPTVEIICSKPTYVSRAGTHEYSVSNQALSNIRNKSKTCRVGLYFQSFDSKKRVVREFSCAIDQSGQCKIFSGNIPGLIMMHNNSTPPGGELESHRTHVTAISGVAIQTPDPVWGELNRHCSSKNLSPSMSQNDFVEIVSQGPSLDFSNVFKPNILKLARNQVIISTEYVVSCRPKSPGRPI